MKRKLLIAFVVAGLLTAAVGPSTLPAGAAAHIITIRTVDGQDLTYQIPDGAPCDASAVPNLPAGAVVVSCQEVPAQTTAAAPSSTSSTGSTSTAQQTTPSEAPTPGGAPQPQGTGPLTVNGETAKPRPKGKGGNSLTRPRKHKGKNKKDIKPKRLPNGQPRANDGTPTVDNPTFSLADTGPAPIGVPNFFIEKFRIPPFLLPLYQAAGTQYGIPWPVLAAINEIETDYGRNLSVSSAGALGWMQFIPSSWKTYGVDANGDGHKDPYNPVDAIFAAARYLRAAGGDKNIAKAIFAYNHADWYVQSVLLRAKLIGGMPADLIGSLTGLTEGHFPVAARATYADDLSDAAATRRVKSGNAAVVDQANANRRAINIYSRAGAPVIAVNDGVIRKVGHSSSLGNYVVLEDAYGNRYTYAHLGKVAPSYPAPKEQPQPTARQLKTEMEMPPRDPTPSAPASAGQQPRATTTSSSSGPRAKGAGSASGTAVMPAKERLFAHPARSSAYRAGGSQQLLGSGTPVAGYATFDDYVGKVLGMSRSQVEFRALKPGAQVIAGTILGRVDKTDPRLAPHVTFSIKPAGRGAPQIDPKPILDGWKLLEATAVYRASGKNPFWGPNAKNPSIGQILLMSKPQLEQRVLNDPRIEIYDCGRRDIQSHLIDRRVLAMLEFVAASGLRPYVSTLKCGHSFYVAGGGMVSEHTYGDAADIAKVNGIPIVGHQGPGSIADITVRRLLTLQGTMQPNQIISLMDYPGASYAWAQSDHADHIHVGFQPLFGDNARLKQRYDSVLKPDQWVKLIARLSQINEPIVPTKPSKYAIGG